MVTTFYKNIPIEETLIFEDIYEKNLRLSLERKKEILTKGFAAWMMVDGILAGEIYGIRPSDLHEKIEDVDGNERDTIYLYSTTILPQFQGKGLGKILQAYWQGSLPPSIKVIIGHATTDIRMKIHLFFGAKLLKEHRNWYGTKRTAQFYRIDLQ
jgi:GNAT superfamily N-acetyltransferase